MKVRSAASVILIAPLFAACGAVVDSTAIPLEISKAAVPRAACADASLAETGLQGQVPIGDQEGGRAAQGYACNMRLISKTTVDDRATNGHLAWLDDCAYVADQGTPGTPPGLAVIDVADPANPVLVETHPLVFHPSAAATVHANDARRMIVADATGGSTESVFVAADGDCTQLTEVGRFGVGAGSVVEHEFQLAEDGMTWFGAYLLQGTVLFDLSVMAAPVPIPTATVAGATHDLGVSRDGTRAYLAGNTDGLRIVDTTAVQERAPAPTTSTISSTAEGFFHTAQPMRINGRNYVWTNGETTSRSSCPGAWGNIIDVTDETAPVVVSEVRLETNLEENCDLADADNAVYGTHFSGVDDPEETTLLFVTWYMSGLRVFDVRDPAHPKEVAYYNSGTTAATFDNGYSYVRYRPESRHVWFTGQTDGLMVLELQ